MTSSKTVIFTGVSGKAQVLSRNCVTQDESRRADKLLCPNLPEPKYRFFQFEMHDFTNDAGGLSALYWKAHASEH